MMTVVCAVLALGQGAGAAPADENPFAASYHVVEPDRIALSPKLDGKIEEGEWDPLATSGGVETCFQWEPDRFHAAATMAVGQELVVSYDRKGDGWLVGKDNLELRLSWADGKPVLHVRWLDATDRNGPKWVPAPEFEKSALFAGSVDGEKWTAELTAVDPGLAFLPHFQDTKFAVRVDACASKGDDGYPAFLPRNLAAVQTAMFRGSNLPGGFRWGREIGWPSLGPGAQWKARITFNGSNEMRLQKLDIRVAGIAGTEFANLSSPFPKFDNKGRAFLDFTSPVPRSAMPGYRNLLATVSDSGGQVAFLRSAFRVLPSVYFDPVIPNGLHNTATGLKVRLPIHVMNRTTDNLRGSYSLVLPEGWSREEGGDPNMRLRGFDSDARRVVQLHIPAGAKGSYPMTFVFDMGERKVQQTEWIAIGEPLPEKKRK